MTMKEVLNIVYYNWFSFDLGLFVMVLYRSLFLNSQLYLVRILTMTPLADPLFGSVNPFYGNTFPVLILIRGVNHRSVRYRKVHAKTPHFFPQYLDFWVTNGINTPQFGSDCWEKLIQKQQKLDFTRGKSHTEFHNAINTPPPLFSEVENCQGGCLA